MEIFLKNVSFFHSIFQTSNSQPVNMICMGFQCWHFRMQLHRNAQACASSPCECFSVHIRVSATYSFVFGAALRCREKNAAFENVPIWLGRYVRHSMKNREIENPSITQNEYMICRWWSIDSYLLFPWIRAQLWWTWIYFIFLHVKIWVDLCDCMVHDTIRLTTLKPMNICN